MVDVRSGSRYENIVGTVMKISGGQTSIGGAISHVFLILMVGGGIGVLVSLVATLFVNGVRWVGQLRHDTSNLPQLALFDDM